MLRLLFGNGSRKMDFAQEWALNSGLSPLLQVDSYFKLKNKFIFNIQQSTAALREKKERWDWPLRRDRAAHTACAMLALKLCPHLFERCFPHLFERLPNWLVVTVVMWSAANVMVPPNSIQANLSSQADEQYDQKSFIYWLHRWKRKKWRLGHPARMAIGFKTYAHEDKFWNLWPMPTAPHGCRSPAFSPGRQAGPGRPRDGWSILAPPSRWRARVGVARVFGSSFNSHWMYL